MRETKTQLRKRLANARRALKGLNRVRRGAEFVMKSEEATATERAQAGKDLIKATTQWKNQYVLVQTLASRI